MIKLKNLITEADPVAPAAMMAKTGISKQGKNLSSQVSILGTLASDRDFQELVSSGLEDGDPKDEVVDFSSTAVSVTEMYPTQAEIGFGNSLADLVQDKYGAIESAFSNGGVNVQMPAKGPKTNILAADVGGKIFILDGHHRWSLCFMINRNATMGCDIMKVPEGVDEEGALKIMQMAIAAKAKKVKTKDFEGDDLMASDPQKVYDYVVENLGKDPDADDKGNVPDTADEVQLYSDATDGALDTPEKIAEEAKTACVEIQKMKGEFPRKIMPQADHSGGEGTQDKVNKALEKGEINWKPPFDKKEGISKLRGKALVEHFQKIARIK